MELLKRVFGLKKIGKVPIPLIVNLSTSYEVILIDLVNANADKELIDSLTKILMRFLSTSTSARSR
jgi:hypothetical protein